MFQNLRRYHPFILDQSFVYTKETDSNWNVELLADLDLKWPGPDRLTYFLSDVAHYIKNTSIEWMKSPNHNIEFVYLHVPNL